MQFEWIIKLDGFGEGNWIFWRGFTRESEEISLFESLTEGALKLRKIESKKTLFDPEATSKEKGNHSDTKKVVNFY